MTILQREHSPDGILIHLESAAEAQSAFFSIISGKKNILDYLNKYSSETIRKEDFLKALKKEIKPGA